MAGSATATATFSPDIPGSGNFYLRPDGTSYYRRPNGTDRYQRPTA
jgi:hypothetical protein